MLQAWAYIKLAWEWARTRIWVAWTVCALLLLVLGFTFSALRKAQTALATCEASQLASLKAQLGQKSTASASVRVKIMPAPDGLASNSSWPAEIVVEASSSAVSEHTETPFIPPVVPVNGLSLGVGYFGEPYGYIGLKMGKVSVNLEATAGNKVGLGADYRFLSW